MFAALNLERDPLSFGDILPMAISWLQDAGGFATVVLALCLLFQLVQMRTVRAQMSDRRYRGLFRAMIACFVCAIILDGIFLGAKIVEWYSIARAATAQGAPVPISKGLQLTQTLTLGFAGGISLIAISLPLLLDIFQARLRPRRIWALARLSMKEAVRRKVLWVFVSLLVVYLFGSWFIEYNKPEDQVRNYVQILYIAMTPLLLLTAALLAAFSIPTDIKQQTIHTILTKPVERFEIVIGRFLGYTIIMTAVLIVMTTISLGYLLRGINDDARYESLKARVPLYGQLEFEGTKEKNRGISVGREWDYRSYFSGPNPPQPDQYAVWTFREIPSKLTERDLVRCEYSFDIYRTTKGVDNKGVQCTFILETWRFDPQMKAQYQNALSEAEKLPDFNRQETENRLAEKFGYFELPGRNVVDFHTLTLDIPSGLFKNALGSDEPRRKQLEAQGLAVPLLRVRVRCDDRTQYVGVAARDLYFRVDDVNSQNDILWFAWNFYKGAFGLWLRLCLVIGLSITFSTYLSGVISFLLMSFLYLGGMFQDFIRSLANPTENDGGGPLESFVRVVRRENMVTPLEPNTQKVVTIYDEVFRWFLRRVLNLLPDIDRFDFSSFVSEGFNISGADIVVGTLLLVGFLVPLMILAYHLLRWREIAGAT
jgi:ABC-type transport system involved in multi-copper enzyme maturation permease subunit